MAEFSAGDVGKLREMTGAGLMDCKKALQEAAGDINSAVDILRKKGIASATKKASREAKEGVIAQYVQPGGRAGVLVEINCETDFVGRNDSFRAFCDEAAKTLAANPKADLEAARAAQVARIGENIKISRSRRLEIGDDGPTEEVKPSEVPDRNGMVAAYIHTGGKVGVLVKVNCSKEQTVSNDDFKQLVRDITLQIAAAHPYVVSRDQIPADVLAKEKEIAAEQVKNKPPQAITKIVEGKLEKFYQSYCLLDQAFVKKDPDGAEVSVRDHIARVGKRLDDSIAVRRFVRFQVGEAV